MKTTCMLLLGLITVGCGRGADEFGALHRYELDAASFDVATLDMIRDKTGLALPAEVKGLNFQYYPPIDPMFAAKIEVPPISRQAVLDVLSTVTNDSPNFGLGFGSTLDWWVPDGARVVLPRRTSRRPGCFLTVTLTEEDERVLLYIGYGVM